MTRLRHMVHSAGPDSTRHIADTRDCQEQLKQMAAHLAHRSSKETVPVATKNKMGRMGVNVDGRFSALRPSTGAADFWLEAYASRLFCFCRASHQIYILAVIYIDRLFTLNPEFLVPCRDVNCLLLASIMMELKWHNDTQDLFPDKYYAAAGAVAIRDLRRIEATFAQLLGWQLHVDIEEYHRQQLQTMMAPAPALGCSGSARTECAACVRGPASPRISIFAESLLHGDASPRLDSLPEDHRTCALKAPRAVTALNSSCNLLAAAMSVAVAALGLAGASMPSVPDSCCRGMVLLPANGRFGYCRGWLMLLLLRLLLPVLLSLPASATV